MVFLILKPLSPEIGYHLLREGGREGGGGVKSLCSEASSRGEICCSQNKWVTQPTAEFWGGGSNPGWPAVVISAAAMVARVCLEPPTEKFAIVCITARPLLILMVAVLPTTWSRVRH